MSYENVNFVFIDNAPDAIGKDSANTKRRAIKIRAAQKLPPQKDVRPRLLFKSASKWNRYQARTRGRQKAKSNTISLDISVLEHPSQDEGALEHEYASTNEQARPRDPKIEELPVPKQESASDNEKVARLVPRMQGAGLVAPFVPLETLNKPYSPLLLEHYLTNLATAIPELDAGRPFMLRTRWFPMVITSPATLNIVLLTSASHYAVCHRLHNNRHIQEVLLHLKYQSLTWTTRLVRTCNQSSGDYGDAIIGAVAKMASYEAMFGLSELYHMHMRALQNMIKIRGGLQALGLDGLLQRMVLWIDLNSAFLLNSTAYFLPAVPLAGHVVLQQPNPSGFLGAS